MLSTTCRLFVTWGITFSLMPTSLNCTVGAGRLARAAADRAGVDDPDRDFLADQELGPLVVLGRDDRLGLHVGQVDPLQRRRKLVRVNPPRAIE